MENFETNKIYCGRCLDVMRKIPDNSIDLVYLDPPFASQADYAASKTKEEIAAFTDRWKGGIKTYIIEMREVLNELYRILKSTGTIYLHCDYHAGHYLNIEMDDIFGFQNFRSEINWVRAVIPFGQKKHLIFPRVSERILIYSKTNTYIYTPQQIPLTKDFITKFDKNDNNKGAYKEEQYTGHTTPSEKFIIEREARESKTKTGSVWYYREYLSKFNTGRPATNNWIDIKKLPTQHKLYPTQKPEELLKRIILASSNENDVVLDPFSGSGTTIKVAQDLKRQFVGIDISQEACKIAAQRIGYPEHEIEGIIVSADVLKQLNPWQFQQFVCDRMSAINTSKSKNTASGGDGGADGIVRIKDEPGLFSGSKIYKKYNGALLQIKQSGAGINVVKNLYATLHSNNKNIGFIVAYNFPKTAFEEAANFKLERDTDIRLIEVEKLCDPKFNPFT